MSPTTKSFYNHLIAEKITDPAFRAEIVEFYYTVDFKPKSGWNGPDSVGEISDTLKRAAAFVSEKDFALIIAKYKEAYNPKTENEIFTDKFIKMLDKYNIPVK